MLLRPKRQTDEILSWADTAKAMAAAAEDWSDWDAAVSDGIDAVPWKTACVAAEMYGE